MSPRTLKSKLQDVEALKAKLAKAEAEIKSARESVIERIADLFEPDLVAELTAMETSRLSVSIVDGAVKVTLGGAAPKRTGGGAKVEITEPVSRTFKGQDYSLEPGADGTLTVSGPEGEIGTATSATGAAKVVLAHVNGAAPKSVNGAAWWALT